MAYASSIPFADIRDFRDAEINSIPALFAMYRPDFKILLAAHCDAEDRSSDIRIGDTLIMDKLSIEKSDGFLIFNIPPPNNVK